MEANDSNLTDVISHDLLTRSYHKNTIQALISLSAIGLESALTYEKQIGPNYGEFQTSPQLGVNDIQYSTYIASKCVL